MTTASPAPEDRELSRRLSRYVTAMRNEKPD